MHPATNPATSKAKTRTATARDCEGGSSKEERSDRLLAEHDKMKLEAHKLQQQANDLADKDEVAALVLSERAAGIKRAADVLFDYSRILMEQAIEGYGKKSLRR